MILNINEAIIACNKLKEIDLDIGTEYLTKINKVKQPLKQAVHCKTQEEWDFVLSKCNQSHEISKRSNKFDEYLKRYPEGIAISIKDSAYCGLNYLKEKDYQILSFQEWCGLNGYTMESKCEFEVGKYYKFNIGEDKESPTRIIKFMGFDKNHRVCTDLWLMGDESKFNECRNEWSTTNINNLIRLSIEEIQQYLPEGHVDKIQLNPEFKVGDFIVIAAKSLSTLKEGQLTTITTINNSRIMTPELDKKYPNKTGWLNSKDIRHATQEEINNHLISIGQISDLGKQEPEKYPFKKLNLGNLEWEIQFPMPYQGVVFQPELVPITKDNWKRKMILSIDDDEELPMVNIIKTKTVNLLNND